MRVQSYLCYTYDIDQNARVDMSVLSCHFLFKRRSYAEEAQEEWQGILKDFLIKHRAEVRSVILTEYDANKHIALEKSESYREGEAVGKAKGEAVGESRFAALSLKLLSAGRTGDLERAAKDEAVRRQLYQEYRI